MIFSIDKLGFYGALGGEFIPEMLHANIAELQSAYLEALKDENFQQELEVLLCDYVGRPSPLYFSTRLSEKYGANIYMKREDLNRTGAHKINNTVGQILLAKKL